MKAFLVALLLLSATLVLAPPAAAECSGTPLQYVSCQVNEAGNTVDELGDGIRCAAYTALVRVGDQLLGEGTMERLTRNLCVD